MGVLAAVVLSLSAPVAAEEAYTPAFPPEDDLDCALYVAALMAEMDETMTPDNRTGLTSAFTYFIGRYEAQRGLEVAEALAARYTAYQARNPAEVAQTCAIRMRSLGSRLQEAQSALARVESEPAAK